MQIRNSRTRRQLLLLLLIYLASQGFFNPFGLINPVLAKAAFYGLSLIAVLLAYRIKTPVNYPKWPYRCLIAGIFVASIMATRFHFQPYRVSLIVILPFLFGYLYLYTIEKYRPPVELIERALRVLTLCSLLMYVVNLISFPTMIFGETQEEYDMSRGFQRIGVMMIDIVVTYFFFSINRWMIERNRKNLYWILLSGCLIFMSLTRQVIALSAVLGLFIIMQKASWAKKIAVIVTCVCAVYFVLPQIPMVKAMMELSEEQSFNNKNDEDIRIKAWRFYTTEYQTNALTPILGNGVPSFGKSRWGIEVERTTATAVLGGNGCFAVDVGWAGFFWYFGGIATLGLLLLIVKGIRVPKRRDRQYLSYALMFISLRAIASGPILYYSQITCLTIILYMAYASKKDRSNHTQLQ